MEKYSDTEMSLIQQGCQYMIQDAEIRQIWNEVPFFFKNEGKSALGQHT